MSSIFPVLVWFGFAAAGLYVASQLQARGLAAGTATNLALLAFLVGAIVAVKLMRRGKGRVEVECSGKLPVAE
jgi:membrane protein implicated in regulation of membrane protease activity